MELELGKRVQFHKVRWGFQGNCSLAGGRKTKDLYRENWSAVQGRKYSWFMSSYVLDQNTG